jgi:hypothetical protein
MSFADVDLVDVDAVIEPSLCMNINQAVDLPPSNLGHPG